MRVDCPRPESESGAGRQPAAFDTWILRQGLDEAHGDFWQGVGYYHSHDPDEKARYLRAVLRQATRLRALAAPPAAAVHSRDAPAGQVVDQASLLPAGVARKN